MEAELMTNIPYSFGAQRPDMLNFVHLLPQAQLKSTRNSIPFEWFCKQLLSHRKHNERNLRQNGSQPWLPKQVRGDRCAVSTTKQWTNPQVSVCLGVQNIFEMVHLTKKFNWTAQTKRDSSQTAKRHSCLNEKQLVFCTLPQAWNF